VAFNFMKTRVQPPMARDTLGYEYTRDENTSQMPEDEVRDDDIIERLAEYSKTYRRTRLVQSQSTPQRVHQARSVAVTEASEY
jgi:hypothetical protein